MSRFQPLQNQFAIALLLLASLAFVWLVKGFLLAIFWAALLASLFHRMHKQLLPRVRGRESLSALLTLLLILFIVILPLTLVGAAVTRESALLFERMSNGEIDMQAPARWMEQQTPAVYALIERSGIELARIREWLSSAAVTTSKFLASQAVAIGQNTLRFMVQFFVMLYLLFFFIRDGERLVESLIRALPLGDARERRLFSKFVEVSRATLKGTLVIGVVQGTIGGVTLALLGFETAVFWGVVMTVLSILPAVGAALVWVPASIWLIVDGEIGKAVILIAVGSLVIGLVDNLLRPILVGRDTKLPDYLILLSTLGGLAVIGISGFVVGPILAALCVVGWQMFGDEFAEEAPEPAAGLEPAAAGEIEPLPDSPPRDPRL